MAISNKRRLSYSLLTLEKGGDRESVYAIVFHSEKEIKDFKDLFKRIDDDPDPIVASAYEALEHLSEIYDYKLNNLKSFEASANFPEDGPKGELAKRILKKKQYDVEIIGSLIKEVFKLFADRRKEDSDA